MKDSTRKDLLDGGTGLVTLLAIGTILVVAASGCAAHMKEHDTAVHGNKAVANVKAWTPSKRCKTVGKAVTSHVAVLVERNCLRNGLTTVNMIVLNKERRNGETVAAQHAVQAIQAILGFKPVLKVLFYGKAKGKPFFMTAVTGKQDGALAAKK